MKENTPEHIIRKLAIGLILFLAAWPAALIAQESTPSPDQATVRYAEQIESIQKTLNAENSNVDNFTLELFKSRKMKEVLSTELSAYRLHISTVGNLLLLPNTRTNDLEKAIGDHRSFLMNIEEKLKALVKNQEIVDSNFKQVEEQYQLNKKHLEELRSEKTTDPSANVLILTSQNLLEVLATKQSVLEELRSIGADHIEQLSAMRNDFLDLSQKLDVTIKDKKKQALFQRKGNLLVMLTWSRMGEEIQQLIQRFKALTSTAFWLKELKTVWIFGGILIISSLLIYGVFLFLIYRLRRFSNTLIEQPFLIDRPMLSLAFQVFIKSVPLFGTTLFLYLYAQIQFLYVSMPIMRIGVSMLWVILVSKWFGDYLTLWNQKSSDSDSDTICQSIRFLIRYILTFAIAHLIVEWLTEDTGIILLIARVFFEIGLLLWVYRFIKLNRLKNNYAQSDTHKKQPIPYTSFSMIGYLIGGVSLLLDLTGYGSMAIYWFSSLGHTFAVSLWGIVLFLILREWHEADQKPVTVQDEGDKITGNPFRLIIIWLCWLAWFGSFVLSLLVAWGGRQAVIIGFFQILRYPITIGNMRFSLLGFIYAAMILLFTHASVRIWRRYFKDRILAHSGLEVGLQESITTIAVYVFWALGILFALHAFGLNTTSLAVAFGALGIGLGFGLQNIFNNFVSGIILLFERPIQVGDAIELNGIWADVKKINVRSTVVQTWDNASLIIPNSEFISTQVTNWSFSDMRLRRNINVGVAYGSDVELVRKTLLEIAEKMPRVLKNPKPDVLFTNFGDNSLMFRLRVWTVVEHMIELETKIRFEIDRLFRERGITIAFPQRDIHIKTVTDPIPLELQSNNEKKG